MLHWFGLLERISDGRLTKQVYEAESSGRRSRGRPRLTYIDQIGRVLTDFNMQSTLPRRRACMKRRMTVDEAKEVCQDRD